MKDTFIEDTLKEFEDKFYKDYYGEHGQGFKKLSELTRDFISQKLEEAMQKKEEEIIEKELCEALWKVVKEVLNND